ncbi:hypothetical protein FACS1894145_4630 [Bacteroidia bacterium]|nr:hypothetical protein FACS1894145_4630 [Bacteroidia bacterium]
MRIINKLIISIVLLSGCVTIAYSQNCESFLQRATESVSQKNYCDAKNYYQQYSKCNADADVSTEIAMCERYLKLQGEKCADYLPPYTPTRADKQSTRNAQPSGTQGYNINANTKFKLGINSGLLIPETEKGVKTHLFFGGGISGEYIATPNIGLGLNACYYTYGVEEEEITVNNYIMPVTLTGKYYFLTKSIQPYGGVDVGLYTMGINAKFQGGSESDSKSYFGLAPVVGLQFKLSNTLSLDVNAKYNLIFSEGEYAKILGFNVGLVYTFGK